MMGNTGNNSEANDGEILETIAKLMMGNTGNNSEANDGEILETIAKLMMGKYWKQ